MKQQNDKKRKLGNKGFSLVELIVVIAIMAILTGLVAPQVMKYVEQSRVAADDSNSEALKNATQISITAELAYKDLVTQLAATGVTSRTIDINGGTDILSTSTLASGAFKNELLSIIGKLPTVKANGKTGFRITITDELNVTVATY